MLDHADKEKMESHIDGVINDIRKSVKNLPVGIDNQKKIKEVIKIVINKITPESKMILTGVVKQLMKKTLNKELYKNSKIRAEFHKLNLSGQINDKFDFSVPDKIDFNEKNISAGSLSCVFAGAGGAAELVSGGISIWKKSWDPFVKTSAVVGVAAMITAIGIYLYKEHKKKVTNSLIEEYLESVKGSLMNWISSIENYYDEKVNEFERNTVKHGQR